MQRGRPVHEGAAPGWPPWLRGVEQHAAQVACHDQRVILRLQASGRERVYRK